ncbi:MAG: DUF4399 domain-containing protein [Rhodobacteraceae bacterium]|jgi:hypothetical protein|nr:DUF4399 domain-containing protein [Paracoccaceae bacterium]MBL4557180.1 DUF4399 domain-containing protein [Paracoccaceae bacterium]HBG97582.1 rod shape-determining protein RodA [Paracoccaceae bacterium]
MQKALAIIATLAAAAGPALAERTAAPEGARAYIIAPEAGATVPSPVTIRFGLSGMGVAPAGTDAPGTGHHHLLIDIDPAEIDMSQSLPATEQIVHFGGGQTEVTLDLDPGVHTLRLLLGDAMHVPHDPPILSEPVTITVE